VGRLYNHPEHSQLFYALKELTAINCVCCLPKKSQIVTFFKEKIIFSLVCFFFLTATIG